MSEISNLPVMAPEEDLDETGTRGAGLELEEVSGSDVIVEPFNPGLIRVETRTMTIDLLMRRIREGDIDMAPDFQRKAGIWKDGAKSRLIESILIRIPLPAFYMNASDDDKWLVVDELQHLSVLLQFIVDNPYV
ncbi:MAG: DUF262 domain-containing protein [Chloroflexi bacterium]|nr:DUF262 domain-containing protein [Chloroflexota bacterium]